jgi:hypothetical protein
VRRAVGRCGKAEAVSTLATTAHAAILSTAIPTSDTRAKMSMYSFARIASTSGRDPVPARRRPRRLAESRSDRPTSVRLSAGGGGRLGGGALAGWLWAAARFVAVAVALRSRAASFTVTAPGRSGSRTFLLRHVVWRYPGGSLLNPGRPVSGGGVQVSSNPGYHLAQKWSNYGPSRCVARSCTTECHFPSACTLRILRRSHRSSARTGAPTAGPSWSAVGRGVSAARVC